MNTKNIVVTIIATVLIIFTVLSIPRFFLAISRSTTASVSHTTLAVSTSTQVPGCIDASNEVSGFTCS